VKKDEGTLGKIKGYVPTRVVNKPIPCKYMELSHSHEAGGCASGVDIISFRQASSIVPSVLRKISIFLALDLTSKTHQPSLLHRSIALHMETKLLLPRLEHQRVVLLHLLLIDYQLRG
jgi:hypothetical protein